jgi:hypothetical protein
MDFRSSLDFGRSVLLQECRERMTGFTILTVNDMRVTLRQSNS